MRKIIHLIILAFIIHICLPVAVMAQADGKSQIEDVLALFPAQNKQELAKSMQAISALGESGISQMASSLKPAGAGDNTAVEYAIGSYSYYVTQSGNEEQRQTVVRAYSKALGQLQDNKSRQFIIKQLQQIGKDDAVPVLKNYLADEQLSGPAARALAQIKTPAAEDALLKALTTSDGPARQSIIEALGYAGYTPALEAITKIANTTDIPLKKLCLYAIARMGVPSSVPVLQRAAEKAGYTYDYTEAVSAYILYLHALIRKEKTDPGIAHANDGPWVLKAVLELRKHADDAGQVHTEIAALQLLTEIDSGNGMLLLQDALKNKDITYRAAALGFAAKFRSPETDKQWLRLLPALIPAAQVQVIDFLAQTGDALLLPGLGQFLKSKDGGVKIAAIGAVGKLGGKAALPLLLAVMQTGNVEEIAAAKNALLTLKTNDIPAPIIRIFLAMGDSAKVALLQVLAARSASDAAELVFTELQSTDTAVHHAAVNALAAVVSQQDLPKLFALLNSAKASDVDDLQQAVIEASSNIKDTAARAYAILSALKAVPAGVQYRYFNVLVATGGKTVLDVIQTGYENGNTETKTAAVNALSKANSAKAARILLHIAQQGADETALNGYISIIQNGLFPDDQKLLMLKEAIAVAKTAAQRKGILQEAGECKTFLSLLFAGKYLDDAAVQQEAAHAVMGIALAHSEYNGDIVKKLLLKTMDVLEDADADYERQAIKKHLASLPAGDGFVSMFNGTDLTGWKGLVANPIERAKMNPDTLAAEQVKADKVMREGWFAKDGLLVFGGNGENLCTVKQYGDFDMYVDWKITKEGDAGIYLRGSPQVQIWDTSRISVGAQVGSGGLYNNQKNRSTPLVLADNAIGEWNSFHIIMRGDMVTVYLNGVLVTDNIVLENYWDRSLPIFIKEQIELQAHGTYVAYRNLYIKELSDSPPYVLSEEEKKEGYSLLFNGSDISQWTGNTMGYSVSQGSILVDTADGHPGNLYTKQQYSNFVLRFEFQLTPGANNGIGIRAPLEGDAAYVGMEIQVLDNEAPEYKDLHAYQYHGSVYGVIPAKRGFLKPTGEWNYEEITANGPHIKVVLNGEVILDGNIDQASVNGTADKQQHPGLHRPTGHIGFLGHGSVVRFKNLRIKEL